MVRVSLTPAQASAVLQELGAIYVYGSRIHAKRSGGTKAKAHFRAIVGAHAKLLPELLKSVGSRRRTKKAGK